ncbi:Luc7-like protein 3 [Perkinsus olseni]|uniref:Luc7-like protein 3 n=1 Tax=Perkinsus olseni TaxID=32597 RepID=A0A7J6PIA3_PEROL|nr:Luc7-like protein 3 [Perkinsus olseni]
MEEARALLDQLMGRDRNATAAAKSKSSERRINWLTQDQYCPYYLVDFCPNELFVNTRAYMGSCGKEHCEYTKFRFDQMEDGREKREIIDRYERKLLSYCEYMETQLAQKIRRGKARVTTEIPDIEVPAQNREKIEELRTRINGLVKDAESLAERGRLMESEKKMSQIEPLNEKIRDLSGEKYLHMTRTEFVCDVCGCLVTLNENDTRITLETHEHARGKQHQGWAKIKETSKALREKFASGRGLPLAPPSREAPPPVERPPIERRSPPRSEMKKVEESPKPKNGPESERKSEEYQSKVEDWRTHLSKMRSRKSKHRHHHHDHHSEKDRHHSRQRSRSRDKRDDRSGGSRD